MLLHFNKAATLDLLYRVSGSLAFVSLPRITWGIVKDPSDPARRLMLLHSSRITPSNLSGLAFTVTETTDKRPKVEWYPDPPILTLRDVMSGFSNSKKPGRTRTKLQTEIKFLCEALIDGAEHLDSDIESKAQAAGHNQWTYRAAKKELRQKGLLKSRLEGFGANKQWWLRLVANQAQFDEMVADE